MQILIRLFLQIGASLLLLSAAAKFVSASGSARILEVPDPLLGIAFRYVYWTVGATEAIVAIICLFSKKDLRSATLVAWLATNFTLYRLTLVEIGYHRPCRCLGNLTDAFHIPPQTADTVMKIALAYLLVGSYLILFREWRKRKATGGMKHVGGKNYSGKDAVS